jgi:hypothetical protein
MPTQGWVRFDPTPRGDEINPSTTGLLEEDLDFTIAEYLPLVEPITFDPADSANLLDPRLADEETSPFPFIGAGGDTQTGGLSVPGWLVWLLPVLIVFAVLFGAIPFFKWIRRQRRMRRLESGDISAAWEDITHRLSDLGEPINPAWTPREVAHDYDSAMVPLAVVYGKSVYGDGAEPSAHDVEAATSSLDHTRTRMTTRYSSGKRLVAWYRPGELLPRWMRRKPRHLR